MSKSTNCEQVKIEHHTLGGLSQHTIIFSKKWKDLNMDFIVGLPLTRWQRDLIWFIVDQMVKFSHFMPVQVLMRWSIILSCTLRRSLGYMGCPHPLSLIVVPNSLLSFGNLSKKVLVLMLRLVRHFIQKPMGKRIVISKIGRYFEGMCNLLQR